MLHPAAVGSFGSGSLPWDWGAQRSWCQLLAQGHFPCPLTVLSTDSGTQSVWHSGINYDVWEVVSNCCVFLISMQIGATFMPGSFAHALLITGISPPFPNSAWLCDFLLTCPLVSQRQNLSLPVWVCPLWDSRGDGEGCPGGAWGCPGSQPSPGAAVLMLRALSSLQGKLFESGTSLCSCCLLHWKSYCSCETPELRAVRENKPSAVSFGVLEIHNYPRTLLALLRMCGGCAAAEWITPSKGSERERQLECSKCFAHQLPPILHPERLKAVCLQLCVMSCSVCHLISSPGITRQAWMLQCHLSENSLLKLINSAP